MNLWFYISFKFHIGGCDYKKRPSHQRRSWCPETESNCRHEDFQSSALLPELPSQWNWWLYCGYQLHCLPNERCINSLCRGTRFTHRPGPFTCVSSHLDKNVWEGWICTTTAKDKQLDRNQKELPSLPTSVNPWEASFRTRSLSSLATDSKSARLLILLPLKWSSG